LTDIGYGIAGQIAQVQKAGLEPQCLGAMRFDRALTSFDPLLN